MIIATHSLAFADGEAVTLKIIKDQHGLWATDDGNCFFIEEGTDGKPYLLSGPIMAETNEPPWEDIGKGYEIGEVAWGQIDEQEYCRKVEAILVKAWEEAGRPKVDAVQLFWKEMGNV